jgi:hypothetical protein
MRNVAHVIHAAVLPPDRSLLIVILFSICTMLVATWCAAPYGRGAVLRRQQHFPENCFYPAL